MFDLQPACNIPLEVKEKLPNQILKDAAENLCKAKWTQQEDFIAVRTYRNHSAPQLCMCAHGAIQHAFSGLEKWQGGWSLLGIRIDGALFTDKLSKYQRSNKLSLFLAHSFAASVGLTIGFNDAISTTKEQVIAKLLEAAALAEKEEHKYLPPSTLTD